MVHPDGQESEHTHTYLEISGHWEVTWWLAHTIESVLDPKHVHHPWSQVALCSNTRINCLSECICHVFECILVYLGQCPKYSQICSKYTQIQRDTLQPQMVKAIHCKYITNTHKYVYLPKYT